MITDVIPCLSSSNIQICFNFIILYTVLFNIFYHIISYPILNWFIFSSLPFFSLSNLSTHLPSLLILPMRRKAWNLIWIFRLMWYKKIQNFTLLLFLFIILSSLLKNYSLLSLSLLFSQRLVASSPFVSSIQFL